MFPVTLANSGCVFAELGLEYCPPSQYLLPVLENDSSKPSLDCVDGEDFAWHVRVSHTR